VIAVKEQGTAWKKKSALTLKRRLGREANKWGAAARPNRRKRAQGNLLIENPAGVFDVKEKSEQACRTIREWGRKREELRVTVTAGFKSLRGRARKEKEKNEPG